VSHDPAPRRVLIIDDDPDVRAALSSLLHALGQRVAEAHGGAQGLEMILTHRPDVSLVDIGMRDIDGYELARRVRAAPDGQQHFLVAVTGHAREQDRELALRAGFDAHLVKPVDEQALLTLIASRQPG
jgi:two-component system CheB/CheR fusion protein